MVGIRLKVKIVFARKNNIEEFISRIPKDYVGPEPPRVDGKVLYNMTDPSAHSVETHRYYRIKTGRIA